MQKNYIHNGNNAASSHQACSSCKHQRKKCNEECILAPYFPSHRAKEFQAVHKIFGVSNVQKMIRGVKRDERKKVADSLIWEAFWRQKDPVLGPYGEYKRVYEELRLYKSMMVHQPVIGWNMNNQMMNNNNNNNNNNYNNIDNVSNVNYETGMHMFDLSSYNGCSLRYANGREKSNQDGEVGPAQQPLDRSVTGSNQHYYLSGQFGLISGKTMGSTNT